MVAKANILLVEDDQHMSFLLNENLRNNGYETVSCADGEAAWMAFQNHAFDLCILDVMLPKKDGFSLARQIRQQDDRIPIIFLTARNMMSDKVQGFEIGGDDYITKPFSAQELLLRIGAVLRRIQVNKPLSESDSCIALGKYEFNYLDRTLTFGKKVQAVSTKESELIKVFSENPNQLLNRQFILKRVWGSDDYFTSKSMDVYLTRIRKLLKNDPDVQIQNVHGIGYRLMVKSALEV